MEARTNQTFLTRRRKVARIASYVGFAALFGGLIVSTRYPLASYGLLLLGLISASVGSFLANRYVREPRADEQLARALDGLDRRYSLLSYYLPSDHVVFSHHGFAVLEPRAQSGVIAYRDGRWSNKGGGRRLLQFVGGEPSLGRPDRDLAAEVTEVKRWLGRAGWGSDVPVHGVVVFTNPDAQLDIVDPPCPAVALRDLAGVLRDGLGQPPLPTSQRRELESKLDALVSSRA
jgi:hypothetical protein